MAQQWDTTVRGPPSDLAFSGANLIATRNATANGSEWQIAWGTEGFSAASFAYYWEIVFTAINAANNATAGILNATVASGNSPNGYCGNVSGSIGLASNGTVFNNGSSQGGTPPTFAANNVIGIALSKTSGTVGFIAF